MTVVISAPTTTSSSTLAMPASVMAPAALVIVGRSDGCSDSARPPMPCCSVDKPTRISAKPAMAAPAAASRPRPTTFISAPTKTIGRAAAVSEIRTPNAATSQPVPVVPILAPKTRLEPLREGEQPGADQADRGHRRGARRLHEERDDRAPERAEQRRRRRLFQHRLQGRAGERLEPVGHYRHAQKEQADAADDRNGGLQISSRAAASQCTAETFTPSAEGRACR